MRIRRNPWLSCLTAAAVLSTSAAFAQDTTSTATPASAAASDASTTGSASAAAAAFNLEPGTQLLYHTKGKVSISAGGQMQAQEEELDLETSLTVLQKSGDKVTVYASLTANEQTTQGVTKSPGPRFTFEMPTSGAADEEEFEKAGLAGTAFPTFSVETLFTAPAAEGKTSVTLPLPITNNPSEGYSETTRDGSILKTETVLLQADSPAMNRQASFSTDKKLTEAIKTSATLRIVAQGAPITFAIQDETKLEKTSTLAPDDLENLKKDVGMAIPIAAKLRTLQVGAGGDAMKTVGDQIGKYLGEFPKGEFAFVFDGLQEQINSVVQRTANQEKIKEGAEAPDFSGTTIDDKPIKLSDYKGKVVLIDFWATWCGPCLMELPNIKKLYEANKDKGFEIIGVSADEDVADLKKLVEQENLQWPQIFDGGDDGGKIQEIYGVMKYPTTVLVDKEGKISVVDARGEDLDKAVEKLLGDTSK